MSFKKLYIYFTNEEKLLLRQIIENQLEVIEEIDNVDFSDIDNKY